MTAEAQRILGAYQRRQTAGKDRGEFFGHEDLAHLLRCAQRHTALLAMLSRRGVTSLAGRRILDVGCGTGSFLGQCLEWGAAPSRLAGIDLRPGAVEAARARLPRTDVRCGDASELPWPSGSFDLVCQQTVFSSILDPAMRQRVAGEMLRVLAPGGCIVWYDLRMDNPRNPDVQGISRREILALFPGCALERRLVTLAPPLARRLPDAVLPLAYPLLSAVPWLCTHILGLVVTPAVGQRRPGLRTAGCWEIDRRGRRTSLLRGLAAGRPAEAPHHA
jgi:SAM-dependent methyltransferase